MEEISGELFFFVFVNKYDCTVSFGCFIFGKHYWRIDCKCVQRETISSGITQETVNDRVAESP